MELKDKEIMQAMSDEEDIMKKLQKVANRDCSFCWQKGENCDGDECEKVIAEKILNIYNRQKADIERLQAEIQKARRKALLEAKSKFAGHSNYHGDTVLCILICIAEGKEVGVARPLDLDVIKSEAIKEFAEMFIDEECAYCSSESDEMIFFKKRFDNFLAEMVGEQNA